MAELRLQTQVSLMGIPAPPIISTVSLWDPQRDSMPSCAKWKWLSPYRAAKVWVNYDTGVGKSRFTVIHMENNTVK